MRRAVRTFAGLVLVIWLVWVYGSWADLVPSDLFGIRGPIPTALAFFGTPILCLLLIGLPERAAIRGGPAQRSPEHFPEEAKSSWRTLVQVIQIAPGLWFLSAFVAMFLTERYPILHSYVWWTFAVYAGAFIAAILGVIIFSIAYGARATYTMYRDAMEIGHIGRLGRVLWGIYFVIAFMVALIFARW